MFDYYPEIMWDLSNNQSSFRCDLRCRMSWKSDTCAFRLATREIRTDLQNVFHSPSRQFRLRTTHIETHIASLAHTLYIIFIIRARDTRSRAGPYDAPRCRLIAFKALREPHRWGRLLSCLLVALQSNQNTTRVRVA